MSKDLACIMTLKFTLTVTLLKEIEKEKLYINQGESQGCMY